MRSYLLLAVCVGGLGLACDPVEWTAAGPVPQFGANSNVPDLDGLPDLTVDARTLARSWLIRTEEASQCAIIESGVSPGVHRLLRFTATTPNIGDADVFVGDPLEHVAANDGMFEYALCHDHFHFRQYATYELLSITTGAVVQAAKRGFCMIDVRPAGGLAAGRPTYDTCGNLGAPGFQGISVGWTDSYHRTLDGQYFVLDEPDQPVPPGDYLLRVTVNPPFLCGEGDASRPRDAGGMCRIFAERDYANNVGETMVTIPSDTRGATGPGLTDALSEDERTAIMTKTQQSH